MNPARDVAWRRIVKRARFHTWVVEVWAARDLKCPLAKDKSTTDSRAVVGDALRFQGAETVLSDGARDEQFYWLFFLFNILILFRLKGAVER